MEIMRRDVSLDCYIFTGQIHPERYGWGVNPIHDVVVVHHDGAQSRMRVSIIASQVTVTVHTDSTDSVGDMKNRVSRQVRNLTDSLGFVAGAALNVEILACITPDGQHSVFNTAFPEILDNPVDSSESQRVFNALVRQAGRSRFIRMALSDLKNAISEPLDTCVNSYRAVESIRQEYLPGGTDDGPARKQSWSRLREAIGVAQSDLDWLRELATPRRHGAPIDQPEEQRERALRIARQVVEKHCLAVDDAQQADAEIISEDSDT